jgi:hypothetical protein
MKALTTDSGQSMACTELILRHRTADGPLFGTSTPFAAQSRAGCLIEALSKSRWTGRNFFASLFRNNPANGHQFEQKMS